MRIALALTALVVLVQTSAPAIAQPGRLSPQGGIVVGIDSTAGSGIVVTGTAARPSIGIDSNVRQERVTGTCVGQVLVAIAANGTVTCETDNDTTYTADDGIDLTGTELDIVHTSDFSITSDQLDLSTAVTAPGSVAIATNAFVGATAFTKSFSAQTEITKDAAQAGLVVSSYGTSVNSEIMLFRGRGTGAATTAAQSSDVLGQLAFAGANSSTVTFSGVLLRGVATEAWGTGPSVAGSRFEVYTTENGGVSRLVGFTVDHDRKVVLSNATAATAAAGSLRYSGSFMQVSNATTWESLFTVAGSGLTSSGSTVNVNTGTGITVTGDAVTANLAGASCSAGSYMSALSATGTGTCTAEVGDISGVTAGVALTGGGTSGALTIDLAFSSDFQDTGDALDLSTAVTAPGSVTVATTLGVTGLTTATGGVTTPANLTTTGTGDLVVADDATVTGQMGVGGAAVSADSLAVNTSAHVTDNSTAYLRFVTAGSLSYIQSGSSLTADSKRDLVFTSMNGVTEWCRIASATGSLNCVGGLQENGSAVLSGAISANRVPKGSGGNLVDTAFPIDDASGTLTLGDNDADSATLRGGLVVSKTAADSSPIVYLQNDARLWFFKLDGSASDRLEIGDATSSVSALTIAAATGATTFYGNTQLGDAGTDTVYVPGYVGIAQAADANVALRVNSSTRTYGGYFSTDSNATVTSLVGTNAVVGKTGTPQVIYGTLSGSFDATAAGRVGYAGYFEAVSTRSAGSNSVQNVAAFFHAANAQDNVAIYTYGGNNHFNTNSGSSTFYGNTQLGGATTAAHTINGNVVHAETAGVAYQVTNTPSAGTDASIQGLNAMVNGTLDATAAQRLAYGVVGQATASRSAGANSVVNYGLYGNAMNGQANYALYTDSGDVQLNTVSGGTTMVRNAFVLGNAQLGDSTSADSHTILGLTSIHASGTAQVRLGDNAGNYYGLGRDNATTGDFVLTNTSNTVLQRVTSAGAVTFPFAVSVNGNAAIGDAPGDAHSLTGTLNANGTAGAEGDYLAISSGVPKWITGYSFVEVAPGGLDISDAVDPSFTVANDDYRQLEVILDANLDPTGGPFSTYAAVIANTSTEVAAGSTTNYALWVTSQTADTNWAIVTASGDNHFNSLGTGTTTVSSAGTTFARPLQLRALAVDSVGDGVGTLYQVTAFNDMASVDVTSENATFSGATADATYSVKVALNGTLTERLKITSAGDTTLTGSATVTGALNGYTQITKSTDQDVTNNATHQADTALTFATTAAKAYAVEAFLIVSGSDATGDYAFRFNTTAGTQDGTGQCWSVTTADAIQTTLLTASAAAATGSTSVGTRANVNIPIRVYCQYSFLQNTSAGNFRLEFANAAAAGGRISRTWAGSYLRYRQLN